MSITELKRQYETGRLPLPNYLTAVQRQRHSERQAAAHKVTIRRQTDRLLLSIIPLSGMVFIALTAAALLP